MDMSDGYCAAGASAEHKLKGRYDPHNLFLCGNGDVISSTVQQQRAHRAPPIKKNNPKAVYRL
jgi:hypothetical protein